MRKGILVILALALLAGSASAKLGDLVASFENVGYQTNQHYGLAADATYLYTYLYFSGWRYPIIRMMKSDGRYVSSYTAPDPSGYPQYTRGMSYDGTGYIYGNNGSRRCVYRFRADTGSFLSSWNWPSGGRNGICADHSGTSGGTYIYQNEYYGNFSKSTLTGSLVSTWAMTSTPSNYDLAWDYGNKLIWYANNSTDYIFAVDPDTHKIKTSFRHPNWATIGYCYGIAYWGNRLYVSSSSGTPDEYIWVFDCPNTVGVTPASVGKVKALFK